MSAAPGDLAAVAEFPTTPPSVAVPVWMAELRRAWKWLRRQRTWTVLQPRIRRMELQETVQLGEKRFVSILRVDGEQFLIGGSASGVVLLATMQPKPQPPQSFQSVIDIEERQVRA